MAKSKKLKALVSEGTIVLKYENSVINIQKQNQKALFKKLKKMIENFDEEGLIKEFLKAQKGLMEYAGEDFEINHGILTIKGSSDPLPKCISKRLVEMKKAKVDYTALINFWNKLKENPSEDSKRELYGFIIHNNIALTPEGNMIVEKGVSYKSDKLVDCYTGRIDNSIGMIVEMERSRVNSDRNQTCSRGLHVAPPDYVRDFYSRNIIVECSVNPRDVVSVPIDYNNRKMRVCKYHVTGYAPKNSKKPQIKTHAELLSGSAIPQIESIKNVQIDSYGKYEVTSKQLNLDDTLSKMTAREIIEYTHNQTGEWVILLDDEKIKSKLKNKKGILKKARIILIKFQEIRKAEEEVAAKKIAELKAKKEKKKVSKKEIITNQDVRKIRKTPENGEVIFTGLKAKEIIAQVKKDFDKIIGGKSPRRARVIVQAIKLYSEKGITVIDA